MKTVPLKRIVGINLATLPETTEPSFEFRYVDIGAVGRGQLLSEPEATVFATAPSRARRLVRQGDTIISTVRTYLRAVWPVRDCATDLVVSTGFAVLTPTETVDPRYLGWLVQSDVVVEEVVARSVGVSYPAINPSDIGTVRVPLPPLALQRTIADYLDRETARIDALIEKKKATTDLLKERSQSIISEAWPGQFILALDGTPVGIEGWRCVRLGHLARVQTGLTLDDGRDLAGADIGVYPYLRVANVQDGALDLDEVKDVRVPRALAHRCLLRSGDVLMTEGGDPDKLGRGTVWPGSIRPCLHQNHVFAVRPSPELLPEYLALITRTPYARTYFEMTASKTTGIASTSTAKIVSFRVPMVAPDVQARMVRSIQQKLGEIGTLQVKVEAQTRLLAEHRQALITAAVTGEIEIPGVAA